MPDNYGEECRERLKGLLKELFQFNVTDLDFGIYKIMNQRREEIEIFIERDLFTHTEEAFKEYSGTSSESLKAEVENLKAKINEDFGAGTIDEHDEVRKHNEAPKVQEYVRKREELRKAELTQGQIADVYNQVYEFFNRYFDKGDFFSKRRFGGKNKYAIPYNGEEVKLCWANEDQYYVKSVENFNNYEFRADGWKVKFVLVHAEIEQNNLKNKERFFILSDKRRPEVDTDERVVKISFQYRVLTDAELKKLPKKNRQEKLKQNALEGIIGALSGSPAESILLHTIVLKDGTTKKIMEKHLETFVEKNSSDYFIHKDLKGFLTQELEFYIKNEVIALDELIAMSQGAIQLNLARVKAIREISSKIIDFVSQIEDFQKLLWEKKKMVLTTDYCITLALIPNEYYEEIGRNEAQVAEWKMLFKLDETTKKSFYKTKNMKIFNKEFLDINKNLILDTKYYSLDFKDKLLASIENLDDKLNGILIQSENWQALNLIKEKYKDTVTCIYIDPPYNTNASEILYKNDYKNSSWITLMNDRLALGREFLNRDTGVLCCTIDDVEQKYLGILIENHFNETSGVVSIRIKPSGRPIPNNFAVSHEYAIFAKKNADYQISRLMRSDEQLARYKEEDEKGPYFWEMLRKAGSNTNREDRPTMFFPIYYNKKVGKFRLPHMEYNEDTESYDIFEDPTEGEETILPMKDDGTEGCWYFGYDQAKERIDELKIEEKEGGKKYIYYRRRPNEGVQPTTLWSESKYSATEHGTALLKHIFGTQGKFSYPKSIYAVEDCLTVSGVKADKEALCLDYFAGSGTTAHAIIRMNKEDGGARKYILIEMEKYFETVLKPRIEKIVYSEKWSKGFPQDNNVVTHIFKYHKIEQYEDTLNNIIFRAKDKKVQETLLTFGDYFLRYMLDYETRQSPTRLNIESFENPFEYKIFTISNNEELVESVDLVETFNYLLGLHVERILAEYDGERYYKAIKGRRNDAATNLIIWRNVQGLDLNRDKEFINETFIKKLFSNGETPDIIYANGMCHIDGALPIEPDFRRLMGA